MRLATKLAVAFGLLVALTAGLAFSQLALIQRLHGEIHRLSEFSFRALEVSHRAHQRCERLQEFSHKLALLREGAYAAEAARLRQQISGDLETLWALELSFSELAVLGELDRAWRAHLRGAARREREVLEGRAEASAYRTAVDTELGDVMALLSDLTVASRAAIDEAVAAGRQRAAGARWIARGTTALALAAGALLSVVIVVPIARGVARLVRGTREIGAGRFGYRVQPAGGRELTSLAASFNEMAAQLAELEELKRQLVAALSHDLQAPLASIQESLGALLDGLAGPLSPEQRRLLQMNLESARRLSGMIRDLLDLARLDAGARRLELRPCDLAHLAADVLDEVEPLAVQKGVRIRRQLPEGVLRVQCDEDGVRQILRNFLSNAVKFTPAGGEVGVRAGWAGPHREPPVPTPARAAAGAVLEVWDTGPGVPDEHKERIFDRFFRIADGGEGAGLGLAIARAIAEAHGGRLWVKDRPHGGSVFVVYLPAPADVRHQEPPAGGGAEAAR